MSLYSSLHKSIPKYAKDIIIEELEEMDLFKRLNNENFVIDQMTFDEDDINYSIDLVESSKKFVDNKRTINWLIPSFKHPFGGIFTIFRVAEFLENFSYDNKFIIYDDPNFNIKENLVKIREFFPKISEEKKFLTYNGEIKKIPEANISISTYWTSCYMLLKLRNCNHKLYFIQDYEPSFFSGGIISGLAEFTYLMPFHKIINSEGLYDFITKNYIVKHDVRNIFFNPAVDSRYFFKTKSISDFPLKILFYARPSQDRNGFSLGVKLLEKLNSVYKDRLEIHFAGEKINKRLSVPKYVINDGIVPYKDLPEYYSKFHFGICFMFSRHTSYIPLELMASGVLVVTNYNSSKSWLLEDGVNSIHTHPNIDSLFNELNNIITSDKAYRQTLENAHKTISRYNWDSSLYKIYEFINKDILQK